VQLDRAKAEFRQQAKRFEEAEADLTGDVLDAYDEGFKDALAQVACVHPKVDRVNFSTFDKGLSYPVNVFKYDKMLGFNKHCN